jgi:hypothetical protein
MSCLKRELRNNAEHKVQFDFRLAFHTIAKWLRRHPKGSPFLVEGSVEYRTFPPRRLMRQAIRIGGSDGPERRAWHAHYLGRI